MSKRAYKVLSCIFTIIAVIGCISFIGGVKPVNIGVVVFPLLLAILSFVAYKRNGER